VDMLGDACLNLLDTDKNGTVGFSEVKRMMRIFKVPEDAAYTFFECADVNKTGKLERKDMHDMFIRFWMSDGHDASIDGLYAYKF